RQTFNPDNVMMHEQLNGTVLNDFNAPIVDEILENSKVFQLGQVQDMNGKSEKNFTFWADKPGAYWVGEGRKIQTTKPTTVNATLKSNKVGVIILASREYLNYTYRDFFEAMKPQIAEAVILGVNNPFKKSIDSVVEAESNVVVGEINGENVFALVDTLYDNDVEPNAFISKEQNKSLLRGAVDGQDNTLYDRASNTIDGIPAVDLKSSSMEKGTLYAGDFDKLFFGVPYPMTYEDSTQATLSTIKNEDGSDVNLYEQELVALRVTMDVATLIADDNAFAKLSLAAADEEEGEETP